jgi:hypothetical protein
VIVFKKFDLCRRNTHPCSCNPEADYSGTDVPVIVAVAPGTITDPGPGELQTFCYTVTQVSEPFGLSHWLLGICPTITLDDIVNISVFIDDEEQTVIPGENVEIRTEENPDPAHRLRGTQI